MVGKDGAGDTSTVSLVDVDGVDAGSEVPDSEGGVFGAGDDQGLGGVDRGVCYLLVVS